MFSKELLARLKFSTSFLIKGLKFRVSHPNERNSRPKQICEKRFINGKLPNQIVKSVIWERKHNTRIVKGLYLKKPRWGEFAEILNWKFEGELESLKSFWRNKSRKCLKATETNSECLIYCEWNLPHGQPIWMIDYGWEATHRTFFEE